MYDSKYLNEEKVKLIKISYENNNDYFINKVDIGYYRMKNIIKEFIHIQMNCLDRKQILENELAANLNNEDKHNDRFSLYEEN